MSTYNQTEVIRIVESVLPEISRTGDPRSALIKRAKELNLPSAVLEKAGQAFNTAKTINYLDKAADLEKRGSTFDTLDVADMVSEYSKYEPKETLWDMATKSASSNADTPDEEAYRFTRDYNPFEDEEVKPNLLKSASDVATVVLTDPQAVRNTVAKGLRNIKVARINLDNIRLLKQDLTDQLHVKVANFCDIYSGLHVDAPAMDVLEAESAELFNAGLVKKAFDLVADKIGRKQVLASRVKRASAATQVSLFQKTAFHTAVEELVDSVDMIDATQKVFDEDYANIKSAYADLIKVAANEPLTQEELEAELDGFENFGKGEGARKDDMPKKKKQQEKADDAANERASRDAEAKAKEKADYDDETVAQGEAIAAKHEAIAEQKEKLENLAANKATTTTTTTTTKSGPGAVNTLVNSLYSATDKVYNSAQKYGKGLDAYLKRINDPDAQGTNKYQRDVDAAGMTARAEAALNTLLLTDPVISEYDEEEMRDIFFTILDRNPEVATDINQLRSVLRQAGQFEGGVDLETVKTLQGLRGKDKDNV